MGEAKPKEKHNETNQFLFYFLGHMVTANEKARHKEPIKQDLTNEKRDRYEVHWETNHSVFL